MNRTGFVDNPNGIVSHLGRRTEHPADATTEYIPTSSDVKLAPGLAAHLTHETMEKLVYLDWGVVAEHRAECTMQFDRLIKG
ncbi:hypothetical protein LB518_23535 [Mesorhizobium sp. BR1-1-16]|uniref:hypothetical protein n=1 Tax=Mesorhizobium sp. BR1-1-16 TaxID=2876653 RepID=UPI001CCE4993|nr:hypothetical protein [Mesorhizobium sp. BR1-1-16]MBZ9939285.1 hypothetical protein [Mesorhizobium sp. BR1-1-16]